MCYTLHLPNGQLMQFYIKTTAEIYQNILGGWIEQVQQPVETE